jgi:hypothetical protein
MADLDPEWVKAMKAYRKPVSTRVEIEAEPAKAFQVHGNLWIGSAPPIGRGVGKHFDCLVLCACEYQVPDCFPDIQVAQAIMDDCGNPMTNLERKEAVRAAGKTIRWLKEGLRVLVTCRQGRNRSGTVCGLSLMRGPAKMSSEQAIKTVRAARSNALGNPDFVKFLHAYGDYIKQKS